MTTRVDHNYPTSGALKVTDSVTSLPVADAIIRVYEATAYPPVDAEHDVRVAETVSDDNGEWLESAYLTDGQSWIVAITKRLSYDPETVEITT
jgi:membrane carboxypeptidase/penicillin-binding protein PbpC